MEICRNLWKLVEIVCLIFTFYIFAFICFAQAPLETEFLTGQEDLEQLKESYFRENRYSEFVDYLKGTRKANPAQVSYYIALSRYEGLRYLEETQNWEEYFNRGNEYRQEFIKEALNAIKLSSTNEPLFLYAKCLLWQFHKDMQDEQVEAALKDLLFAVEQYSGSSSKDLSRPFYDEASDWGKKGRDLSAIKYVADKLSSYAERLNSQRVYNLYLERLIASLQEDKEFQLVSLAKQLVYRDNEITNLFFAEEVFKKIDQLNPDFILDEQTQYLRAYNLEKIKQYKDAYLQYQTLVQSYPQTSYYAEALFKMGVISAYVLKDISGACDYFTKLTKGSFLKSPQVFASFYQLGLISQYQGDISKAKEYYNALLDKKEAVAFCADLISMAKARLQEIEASQPLEFNLKTFMDAALKENEGVVTLTPVDIKAQYFKLTVNQDVEVSASAFPLESGCMPVNLEYLWSGELGSAEPGNDQCSFTTHYAYPGTKLIGLAVISPSGILGHSLVFLDVAE